MSCLSLREIRLEISVLPGMERQTFVTSHLHQSSLWVVLCLLFTASCIGRTRGYLGYVCEGLMREGWTREEGWEVKDWVFPLFGKKDEDPRRIGKIAPDRPLKLYFDFRVQASQNESYNARNIPLKASITRIKRSWHCRKRQGKNTSLEQPRTSFAWSLLRSWRSHASDGRLD
jgi:hypothetical protein